MSLNFNLKEFLKYISRFKWLILIIPVIAVITTYFLVRELPKTYKSNALIATGITQQFQQTVMERNQSLDYFKISQQFGNLLEMIKSRKVITGLSYRLILHDLKNPGQSFKKHADIVEQLSEQDKQTAIAEYENRLANNALISVADNNGKIKLYDILAASGYDEESLYTNLTIARNGESDFIKVSFVSPNPQLSAFAVNYLSRDFIHYYGSLILSGQKQSLATLDTLLKEKQQEMQKTSSALAASSANAVSSSAGAMAAQKQSDITYQRITEVESQKSQIIRNISSIEGAIADVNNKLSGSGGYIKDNSGKENSEIINIDNQLQAANQRYINNNFRPEDKASIDSLQRIRSRIVANASQKSQSNPAAIRQNLIDQKIKLENDLAAAKSMLATVEQQLNTMGPKPGIVGTAPISTSSDGQQNLLRDADMAAKDYADVQAEYDKANMIAKVGIRLALAEPGLPGPPEPSKNMLYIGFSGITSLMLCLMTFLVVFMLNKTINTPEQLSAATKQPVIGNIAYINEDDKDLRTIWNDKSANPNYTSYKDSLRGLRLELLKELNGEIKVLGVTSIENGDGRTFIAGSIGYALAMMGKNVLLICDKDDNLMKIVTNQKQKDNKDRVFESFLVKKQILIEDRITILNKNKTNNSLLEIKDSNSLITGFKILKDTFDIVIIDIDSSESIHKVKEWLMFCDKSIAIFEAGNKLEEKDLDFVKYLNTQPDFMGWVINKIRA
ncbi:MAG: cellulose synthase operon protein YhjQ/BcsQ [Niabella sp.]